MTSAAAPPDHASSAPAPIPASSSAYEEAMDDVHARFVLNLPDEELASAPRIFFQLEQAWWFYDDFLCDGADERAEGGDGAAGKGGSGKGGGGTKSSALPRFKHVRPFSKAMFEFSPLLRPMLPRFDAMYDEFSRYKRSISTYGTILLNDDATKLVLCRVYKGKSWTLPGGKVNQGEKGREAAARETYEETGFDVGGTTGASLGYAATANKEGRGGGDDAPSDEEDEADDDDGSDPSSPLPWPPLLEANKLAYVEDGTEKRRTCYVCRGVPEDFPFAPVARKEVSEVSWHEIKSLPRHTYAVLPFVGQLRRWIKRDDKRRGVESGKRDKSRDKSRGASRAGSRGRRAGEPARRRGDDEDFGLTPFFSEEGNAPWEGTERLEDGVSGVHAEGGGAKDAGAGAEPRADSGKGSGKKEKKRDKSSGKKGRPNSRSNSRPNSRGRAVAPTDDLVTSSLASPGDPDRWTEEEMFARNEELLGRKLAYDGNPHDFAEKGFDVEGMGRVDPHAFRVVGGTFMNAAATGGERGGGASAGAASGGPPPGALQPLVNRSGGGGAPSASTGEFTPFFSDDGRAPWEEAIAEEAAASGRGRAVPPAPVGGPGSSKGLALLSRLRRGVAAQEEEADVEVEEQTTYSAGFLGNLDERRDVSEKKKRGKKNKKKSNQYEGGGGGGDAGSALADPDDIFMTDREITAQSQKEKLSAMTRASKPGDGLPSAPMSSDDGHLAWMRGWAERLPLAEPTEAFGDFRIDVSAVMNAMAAATAP
ncbi:hypothetical protein ACHAWF_004658 [Thalassiosira exigua]